MKISVNSSLQPILILLLIISTIEVLPQKIGDLRDGSKSTAVHLIKLFDADSIRILKSDNPLLPFSTKYSCGECHSYNKINNGLHFNSHDKKSVSGRKGEPSIYVDWRHLTILPLSYRNWKGTYNPSKLGITTMRYLDLFGSHFTGGGIGDVDSTQHLDDFFRWEISGKLEINCLACHNAHPEYDPAEYAAQVQKQNYKWAVAGASEIAEASGNAGKMPVNFNRFTPTTFADIDVRATAPPSVTYNTSKFNSNNMVFFNIKSKAGNDRCYFCHSSIYADKNYQNQWNEEEDVHLSKGMSCADCHKNGLDHNMVRGYRNEFADYKREELKSFTCEGCHLGKLTGEIKPGKLGAPVPEHKGIPLIHFEKLECTVCHSGKLPEEGTSLIKTSRAHKLGLHKSYKEADLFPHIQSPVYVRNNFGKLEPHNLIYPSFWGIKKGDIVEPASPNIFDENFTGLIKLDTLLNYGKWHQISDSTLISALNYLNKSADEKESFVFVTGGKVYELINGRLENDEHESASYYSWAIGHNVKPASQSLGVNGCDDCHAFSSNFFFGDVFIESSLKSDKDSLVTMANFQELNSLYQKAFSLTFYFRPWLKIVMIFLTSIMFFVFVIYMSKGLMIQTSRRSFVEDKGNKEL